MDSRQTKGQFSQVDDVVIKDIMQNASKRFKRHFTRVYNGFKGFEIPKSLMQEILSKPEFQNSVVIEDGDKKFQFLTIEMLEDEGFLYLYEDLHKANTLTGIIFIGIDAFVEVKNSLEN